MPAYCHAAAYTAFEREMPHVDTTTGLFRAAFAIARHEHPAADVAQGEAVIAGLANTVRNRIQSHSIDTKLAHLHDVLFDVVGFSGNVEDYYNPSNSYLPSVLQTHKGLPITLVLVYKCVAEQLGLAVCGINSPGHFLAAVRGNDSNTPTVLAKTWMYLDPFFGGELLARADVYRRIAETTGQTAPPSSAWLAPATHRQWLARMLNNLQAVFAYANRERDLYAMQELHELLTT